MEKIQRAILLLLTGVCLLLTGCQPGVVGPVRACPGKASIDEAVETLLLHRRNLQPLQGRADCIFHYKDEKGKMKRKEVKAVNVRFIPHTRILFRGNVFGDVVGFGANHEEFWLRIKPDMDSYWWGTRAQAANCSEALLINPYNVIEALGTVEITTDWQLSYEAGYDIFTLSDTEGTPVKRVYADACDYLLRRIEYFDNEGLLKASAELNDYTTGEHGLVVPTLIDVSHYQLGIPEGRVEIQLKHLRPFEPNEKQLRYLFQRPERDGFGFMYRLDDNCEFIEE